jgi:hypothetical protein
VAKKRGLYDNIHAKRKRIKAGSGETMRPKGAKGAPSEKDFEDAAKTAKMAEGGLFHRGCGAVMPDRRKKTKYR